MSEELEFRNKAKVLVLELLQDYRWHSTKEINAAAGSSEGTRRARDLRKEGYNLLVERDPNNRRLWRYSLVED